MDSHGPEAGGLNEESFLRAVLDETAQMVYVFDSTGRPRWWNQAVRERSGRSAEELESMAAAEAFEALVVDADRERARAAIDHLLERETLTVELSLRAEDGKSVPFEFRGSTAPVADETAYMLLGYEISDRVEREQKVEQLRSCTLDLMQTTTRAESADVAATASNEVIGAPLSGVFYPGDNGERLELAASAHELADTFETEPCYERDSPPGSRGALVWKVFQSGEPVVLDDSREAEELTEESPARSVIIYPLGEHGILIASSPEPNAFDDTDEALVEILASSLRTSLDRVSRESRLRKQNERLDEFASILSHDLRNPLNVAEGHLQLARETTDPEPNYDAIGRSLDRIGTLVDDLLTLAREGEVVDETERVNLATFANSCWRGVQTGDAELLVDLDGAVSADGSRLRQLFENLFRNAVEHAILDERTDPLQVTVGPLEQGDGFFVSDDGIGIPESDRERVLSPGYSTETGGTGLGLSIVTEVARSHGWSISVTESPKGGAQFEFRGVEWL